MGLLYATRRAVTTGQGAELRAEDLLEFLGPQSPSRQLHVPPSADTYPNGPPLRRNERHDLQSRGHAERSGAATGGRRLRSGRRGMDEV
jgi:hypothetical protein